MNHLSSLGVLVSLCCPTYDCLSCEKLAKQPFATRSFFCMENFLSQAAQPNDKQNPSLPNTWSGLVFRLGFFEVRIPPHVWCKPRGSVSPSTVLEEYMAQSLHIGLYWPFTNLPFGSFWYLCHIYFDLKVQGIFKKSPTSEKGLRFVSFQGFQEESHGLHFSRSLRRHVDHVSGSTGSTDKQTPPIKGVWKPKKTSSIKTP